MDEVQSITAPREQSSIDPRAKVAIDRLISQQRLGGTDGIQVRLSNQNKIFLNMKRPTRVGIPAELLEKMVPGFKAGVPSVLKVIYVEKGVTFYHSYTGGNVWIPTAPKDIGLPDDILSIKIEQLQLPTFLGRPWSIEMVNESRLAWFADFSKVRVGGYPVRGAGLQLVIEQDPPPDDCPPLTLDGRMLGNMECKDGVVFTDFTLRDVFGQEREYRLFSAQHSRLGLGVKQGRSFLPVSLVSSDGVRLRVAYEYSKGISTTTQYLRRPFHLYSLDNLYPVTISSRLDRADCIYHVSNVRPLRELELSLINRGNC
jgi:hypothetical protein